MIAIGRGPRTVPGDERALLRDDLLACHDRIRRFAETAVALAGAEQVAEEEIRETARALVGYFGSGLPRHVADEENSLKPRLLALELDAVVDGAIARMCDEHGPIERLVCEGLPRWGTLILTPGALPSLRPTLREIATDLRERLLVHVAEEEADVFPALSRLSLADVQAIRGEMRKRRE